mgnify:CR=1 FL=1
MLYFLSIAVFSSIWTCVGAFLALLILGVSLLTSFFYARWITRPIVDISHIAASIAALNFSSRWAQHRTDEIGALGDSLNTLSDNLSDALTELETANERLQQDMERERDMERQRSAFFSAASHELKTPMMAVQGCAEGIHTGVLDPVGASGIILEETEQMSELVEELLALSRLESGQVNAEFHLTDVRELLYDCLRSTEQLAEQKNLRISLRFDETPVLVNCDEIQLRRAFTNIITNALRYAKEEIQIECKADRGKAVVRIRDDGEGIAPELLPHIFDRFFSTRKGGAGIGLALVKETVTLHRGNVRAANDGGAVFEISLPLR